MTVGGVYRRAFRLVRAVGRLWRGRGLCGVYNKVGSARNADRCGHLAPSLYMYVVWFSGIKKMARPVRAAPFSRVLDGCMQADVASGWHGRHPVRLPF